jgi:hypothetical protein
MTAAHYENFATSEIIRPAAVLLETAARQIIAGLAEDDVHDGGHWWTRPGVWRRYDRPWPPGAEEPASAVHLGTISCVYDSPQRYSVTIFRASVTPEGVAAGWSVNRLCDDALQHAGLTLESCPRAQLLPPPAPFRMPPEQRRPVEETPPAAAVTPQP